LGSTTGWIFRAFGLERAPLVVSYATLQVPWKDKATETYRNSVYKLPFSPLRISRTRRPELTHQGAVEKFRLLCPDQIVCSTKGYTHASGLFPGKEATGPGCEWRFQSRYLRRLAQKVQSTGCLKLGLENSDSLGRGSPFKALCRGRTVEGRLRPDSSQVQSIYRIVPQRFSFWRAS